MLKADSGHTHTEDEDDLALGRPGSQVGELDGVKKEGKGELAVSMIGVSRSILVGDLGISLSDLNLASAGGVGANNGGVTSGEDAADS
ncbi:hypothetical protein COEREDRAFT_12532 [Coemansia reversa NRRL 1564]|uniref:Uncharacterized protein n=1 Tax=Coemansia reversa (strain ATCC 12441 / NRRL 1564) TaxID=763665 RepID=A0A2G5B0Q5_COERN|nr:hypothetical protein COEREDRAFT_12532 [Coemansia reversa NRRL 1564]|eukprot:PIA12602.1 hypothetical protein COEREDRAFT_12532 [Coemansia reversa NRRL 1564]